MTTSPVNPPNMDVAFGFCLLNLEFERGWTLAKTASSRINLGSLRALKLAVLLWLGEPDFLLVINPSAARPNLRYTQRDMLLSPNMRWPLTVSETEASERQWSRTTQA